MSNNNYLIDKLNMLNLEHYDLIINDISAEKVNILHGQPELIKKSNITQFKIRAIKDSKQLVVSAANNDKQTLDILIQNIENGLKIIPESEIFYNKNPEKSNLDLNQYNKQNISLEQQVEYCKKLEAAANNKDNIKVNNCSFSKQIINKAHISKNCNISSKQTNYSSALQVIAAANGAMENGYDYDIKCHYSDLMSAEDLAQKAITMATEALNPKKIANCKLPVIFVDHAAEMLLSYLVNSISGAAIFKNKSFNVDKIGQQIMPNNINIIDDPLISKSPYSRNIDAEFFQTKKKYLVKNGVLENYLLNLESAQKLKLKNNFSASLGAEMASSVTNCFIENGKLSKDELISQAGKAIIVTSLIGMGVNGLTGDFSQGAKGFYVENGHIQYAINNFTIAENLADMFRNMQVANDLNLKNSLSSPTILVDIMSIAGN